MRRWETLPSVAGQTRSLVMSGMRARAIPGGNALGLRGAGVLAGSVPGTAVGGFRGRVGLENRCSALPILTPLGGEEEGCPGWQPVSWKREERTSTILVALTGEGCARMLEASFPPGAADVLLTYLKGAVEKATDGENLLPEVLERYYRAALLTWSTEFVVQMEGRGGVVADVSRRSRIPLIDVGLVGKHLATMHAFGDERGRERLSGQEGWKAMVRSVRGGLSSLRCACAEVTEYEAASEDWLYHVLTRHGTGVQFTVGVLWHHVQVIRQIAHVLKSPELQQYGDAAEDSMFSLVEAINEQGLEAQSAR